MQDYQPHFILLDLGMPGVDGYEVARRIAQSYPNRPFHLVAVTDWGQEADRARSKAAGFDLHLAKPVEVEELESLLTLPIDPRGG